MTIEEIYKNKRATIENGICKAFNHIYNNIDNDKDYELADEELIELVYELMEMYLKKNKS